jgi:hypothetical protein
MVGTSPPWKEAAMTTFAANEETGRRLSELDERTREAWHAYRDALRDLDGDDYAEAEHTSWELLQLTLAEIGAQRRELAAIGALPGEPA